MPLVFKKSKSFRSLIRVGGLIGRSCASSVIFYSGLLSAVVLECCGFGVLRFWSGAIFIDHFPTTFAISVFVGGILNV